MTMHKGRHFANWWMVCVLAACGGQLFAGNPDGGGGGGGDGGGQMGACAPGAPPMTPEQEMVGKESDGQECVIPSCAELDPDQMGELGGINVLGPDVRQVQLDEFGKGCEPVDPSCTPRRHKGHRGGNLRHNVCSDEFGPYRNDYYTPTDPPNGKGDDAVINGFCLDGIHVIFQNDGTVKLYVFWEMKTARYGFSRLTGRPVCLYIRRKILANVLASILKEYPAVRDCGDKYRYQVVLADKALYSAFNTLRMRVFEEVGMKQNGGAAALHLQSWNLTPVNDDFTAKRAVTINSLLTDDLHISTANLDAARTIVVAYLIETLPTAMAPLESPACDNWVPPKP